MNGICIYVKYKIIWYKSIYTGKKLDGILHIEDTVLKRPTELIHTQTCTYTTEKRTKKRHRNCVSKLYVQEHIYIGK